VTDRRSLELFGIWFGFLVGTIIWILVGVSVGPLSIARAVFMFAATVFTFGAVVRALRLNQPRDPRSRHQVRRGRTAGDYGPATVGLDYSRFTQTTRGPLGANPARLAAASGSPKS
jgi:hypothetical protein